MIKNKIVKHLIINGKKERSERILNEGLKSIQKESTKQIKKIINLAIINTTPMFKLHKISNKKKKKKKKKKLKEIPAFISKKEFRISLAIKSIITAIKKPPLKTYIKIKQELLKAHKNEGLTIQKKEEVQNKVLVNKRYFNYYRW